MSGKLQASASSHEIAVSSSSKASVISNPKANNKCFELFLSCFRINSKKESLEDIVNSNAKEYDYIVEKLIVKRVPFIFFSMSENALKNKINPESKSNSIKDGLQLQTRSNSTHSAVSETQSLLYYSNRFDPNMISLQTSNKCLYFDKNTFTLNERNKKHTLSNDYHTRITELMNTMSSLHPDLKEHERPPKDCCSLNMPKNKSVMSAKMSLKGLRNNIPQEQEIFKSQSFIQEAFLKKKEFRNVDEIKSKNDQKIYSLNQMEYMNLDNLQANSSKIKKSSIQSVHKVSCNSANFVQPIIDMNQMNIENKTNNRRLQYNHQSSIKQSKTLSENIVNTDPSSTILRWNIIIKHCKSKTYSSKKMRKYFNIS
ncbi:uncharacterized protein LOC117159544 [Bombus vancouverensis nearcticus]|uniref:uncharacterized protein LOC117159544 n=1 Tax=Bombus vancouverensis nearcticus TaxID=2705178 RepID=UPI00143B5EFC|nr:uncharacterized protein LOC117159544 [Bombus vancouverensis nearcticus]